MPLSSAQRRELRRGVRSLLRELDITSPLDVDELRDRLGRLWNREIVLHPTTSLPVSHAYALWVRTGTTDYVVYQQATSTPHQRHLILHELAHMIAGHHSDDDGALAALMPTLSSRAVEMVLARHAYDTRQEEEAEYIASTILRWAAELEVRPVQPVEGSAADRALNDPRGWL